MEELKINPEKKMVELVEAGRKSVASLKLGEGVKFVGWQLHYISGGVLSSIGREGRNIMESGKFVSVEVLNLHRFESCNGSSDWDARYKSSY